MFCSSGVIRFYIFCNTNMNMHTDMDYSRRLLVPCTATSKENFIKVTEICACTMAGLQLAGREVYYSFR